MSLFPWITMSLCFYVWRSSYVCMCNTHCFRLFPLHHSLILSRSRSPYISLTLFKWVYFYAHIRVDVHLSLCLQCQKILSLCPVSWALSSISKKLAVCFSKFYGWSCKILNWLDTVFAWETIYNDHDPGWQNENGNINGAFKIKTVMLSLEWHYV